MQMIKEIYKPYIKFNVTKFETAVNNDTIKDTKKVNFGFFDKVTTALSITEKIKFK